MNYIDRDRKYESRIAKMIKRKKLIILVGDTGSGKTHLSKILESKGYSRIINTTSREPRDNEVDGVDYNFIKEEDIDSINFLECEYIKNSIYGITIDSLESKIKDDKDTVVIIEPKGMINLLRYLEINQYYLKMDITIIYLDVPEELRYSRVLNSYLKDETKLDSSFLHKDYNLIETELLNNNTDLVKNLYSIDNYSPIILLHKYITKTNIRMSRFEKDSNGKTIFDRTFDPSHSDHKELKHYVDLIGVRWFRYNPLDSMSMMDLVNQL